MSYFARSLVLFAFLAAAYAPSAAQAAMPWGDCIIVTNAMGSGSTNGTAAGQVSLLQYFLKGYGYLHQETTGYFGSATRSALHSFQAEHGLAATGSTDTATRSLIRSLTCFSNDETAASQPVGRAAAFQGLMPLYQYGF